MKTLERTTEMTPAPTTEHRRSLLVALVAVLALIVGAFGGWMLRGDGDGDSQPVVGGGELTERQEEMLSVAQDYQQAWLAEDADLVTSFLAPEGRAVYLGDEMSVEELHDYIEAGSWTSLDFKDPQLVGDRGVTGFYEYRGAEYASVLDFTASGEVLILTHTIGN